MSVPILTSENFKTEVLDSKDAVLVDFFAPWCGPCQMMLPILEKASFHVPLGTKIVKVNVDESGDLAQEYDIMSIPTLSVFKGGKEVDRMVGVLQERDILELLQMHAPKTN